MFNEDDKVMVTCKEISDNEELGIICAKTPFRNIYEVSLLIDHKPGSGADDIRMFNSSEIRIATQQEIDRCIIEWENKHNYKLQ